MNQAFELPVLSLAIPNINKLEDINEDNLSYMWTVFSKCKDSLENGRRLENMSWRLWYRESLLKRTMSPPIPIQPLINTSIKESDKPLSSLKSIISSLNENEITIELPKSQPVTPKTIIFEKTNVKSCSNKFFINEEDESDTDEGWSSDSTEDEDEEPTPKTDALSIQVNTHHVDCDETAFLSEFKKRFPIKRTKGHSILSNMLRAERTRLASQVIHVAPNQKHVTDELSASMRKCLEWEQHGLAHDIILNSSVESSSPPIIDEMSIGYW